MYIEIKRKIVKFHECKWYPNNVDIPNVLDTLELI